MARLTTGQIQELIAIDGRGDGIRTDVQDLIARLTARPSTVVDLDADPHVPEGLTLVSHKKGGRLDLSTVKVVPYYTASQKAGKVITGNVWAEEIRTEGAAVANANLCDYYHAHPEAIPKEFEKDGIIFFPDTVYRDDGGHLFVRYLYLRDGVWGRYYRWLDDDWFTNYSSASVAG